MLTAALEDELAEPLVLLPLLPVAEPVWEEPERVDEPEADEDPLVEVEALAPAVPLV